MSLFAKNGRRIYIYIVAGYRTRTPTLFKAMRAVVYEKPFTVSVLEVPKPTILHPDDVIVKVTTTCICGRSTTINSFAALMAMGPYPGGQAEYVRVPFADFNALVLPPGTEHEEDFALLADIFPTGWHGVQLSGFRPGESVVVFGAGPVGLMAAYSAIIRGASNIFVVDRVPERLQKAKEIGATPIDFSASDPVEQILKLRGGKEVDRGVDAVGYQAVTSDGKTEQPNVVLESLIRVVRPTGGLGIPGLYVPSDPGAPDSAAAKGYISFPFGKLFEKGLSLGTGQCNVKAYNRYLRDLIIAGRAKPSFVVSHNLTLDAAVEAYEKFDKRIDGYTKVLLHP
ncbi:glutathione-independent formaldehyde dehydrogenase [Lentinula edodes]|uniref:Glutathione-independent formaldehyde dehydrogenase n=1 Tax=Lentinula edodes TaxID=5353 RepID=A0A1Q3E487_LENED|nr:glutathione-independent formaldehyde dehydrogenase [Lentinula edodes]